MNEFVTVSSSSYDPASLATKLTEKSAQGWTIVAIVPTGGDVTAFLSRDSSGTSASSSSASSDTADTTTSTPSLSTSSTSSSPSDTYSSSADATTSTSSTPDPIMIPEVVASEPAGWAVAPDPAPTSSAPATVIQSSSPVASIDTSSSSSYQPAPAAPAPTPTPSVPAGWYADPAGRFDLRYWDGGTWTEHVSRAGQQFTDPPVA